MSKRIVIAGGGSGGHVYPALAIAQGLVEEGVDARDITFIGGRNSIEKTVIPQHGFVLTTIPGKGLNRSEYIKNIYHAFQLAYACIMLLVKFSRSRPLVIIGVGGYASMPALVAASILVIPRYVHEQNSYVGRTNRLACLLGAKMMTTWPETTGAKKKSLYVGLPLIQRFNTSLDDRHEFCKKTHERFVVVVSGGSLGARSINDAVIDMVRDHGCSDFDIIHISGARDYERCANLYRELNDEHVTLHSYRDDVATIYARSNVAISRGGAGTCVEFETLGLECIVIPLPSAPGDHQRRNAAALVHKGLAVIVNQAQLSGDVLYDKIMDRVRRYPGSPGEFTPYRFHLDARRKIAQIILERISESGSHGK